MGRQHPLLNRAIMWLDFNLRSLSLLYQRSVHLERGRPSLAPDHQAQLLPQLPSFALPCCALNNRSAVKLDYIMGVLGTIRRFLDQMFPPSPVFSPESDIPDLTGKVVIVTGGNSGVGKETAKQLLLKNAKVYMASRSRDRAEEEIRDLKQQTGKEAIFLELDLSGLEKVTKAANEFKSKETELHILFNSAATLGTPPEQLTDDGLDLQFGTNVIGHAHFTLLLIPELSAGAKSSSDGKARVVNVSSSAVYLNHWSLLDWKTLETDGIAERRKLGTVMLYNQSKYGVLAFSNELARRYVDQGIISNAINPGAVRTRLFRRLSSLNEWVIFTFLAHPPERGALTQLYVGTSPETKDANGKWFVPFARECSQDGWTRNPDIEAKLWDWIEEKRKRYC